MNGRERYFNTINFKSYTTQCSRGPVVRSRTFFAGESWGAGLNPGLAISSFFFLSSSFYPLAFYFLFSLLTLLASRYFCEYVFLVLYYFMQAEFFHANLRFQKEKNFEETLCLQPPQQTFLPIRLPY